MWFQISGGGKSVSNLIPSPGSNTFAGLVEDFLGFFTGHSLTPRTSFQADFWYGVSRSPRASRSFSA